MLLHDLGAHFGEMDVSVFLTRLTTRQRAHWAAYFSLKPPIADRLDVYLPKLFADLMNMWRGKDDAPTTFDDLHIDWAADPPEQIHPSDALATAEADMAAVILGAFT